jgi:putative transposase
MASYPYLLRGMVIDKVNQVWSTDITYIPMAKGFMYLVAVIDWHSRYVLSWELSNTMDTTFCIDALKTALDVSTLAASHGERTRGLVVPRRRRAVVLSES